MNLVQSVLWVSVFFLISLNASAQKIPLINSGEVIKDSKVLYDSGKYDEAIKVLRTIPPRDTNYVYMLSELLVMYNANKQYDSAIHYANVALDKKSNYRAQFLRSRAFATERKGEFEKAVSLYESAIGEYPFEVSIRYNLALAYYNNKKYDEAAEQFFKILKINPFHSGSHLNLGFLAAGEGRKTHAIFSFGMYLSINREDNARLIFLDNLVSNKIKDEYSLPLVGENACEKLDQILKSKVALDKNYKTDVPLEFPVVRQLEMFFDQLSTIKSGTNDMWVKQYLDFYKMLKEQGLEQPFIYNLLTSVDNDVVKKWKKKNEKELDVFFASSNKEIIKVRAKVEAPPQTGLKGMISAWYSSANKLEELGEKSGEKRIGHWYFYHDNSEKAAEGDYNQEGEKIGIWKYYFEDGSVKSIENYETGEMKMYFEEGTMHKHFFLKDEKVQGLAKVFDRCGNLLDSLQYVDNKREGSGKSLYSTGKPKVLYSYHEDELEGEYKEYFETGQLMAVTLYTKGIPEGKYTLYHINGKIKSIGNYVAGKEDGKWQHFRLDGTAESAGEFKSGIPVGEWRYYDERSQLTETRVFNEKGELHGACNTYHAGALHYTRFFVNGVLNGLTYFNKAGKVLGKYEGKGGSFQAKIYYACGKLNGEGSYLKGKQHGVWTYFFPTGKKLSEYTFENGLIQGEAVQYFMSGSKKFVFHYKDDEYDGYFTEFYMDGTVKQEGWYLQGSLEQQWLTYHTNGKVATDSYYLFGTLTGRSLDYNIDGRLASVTEYNQGQLVSSENYSSTGLVNSKTTRDGRISNFETYATDGHLQSKSQLCCGKYEGKVDRYYAKNLPDYRFTIRDDKKHGLFESWEVNGMLRSRGNYVDGEQDGEWNWYYLNGNQESKAYFVGGVDTLWISYYESGGISSRNQYRDGVKDGLSKYYAPDGTLIMEKQFENDYLVSYRVADTGGLGAWIDFVKDAVIVAKYANGKIALQEQYKDGLLDGSKKIFYPDGKPYSIFNFEKGDYKGSFELYYSNGKVRERREYLRDEMTGVREAFNEDGTKLLTENYVEGIRQGKTLLYDKGKLKQEFTFWAGYAE